MEVLHGNVKNLWYGAIQVKHSLDYKNHIPNQVLHENIVGKKVYEVLYRLLCDCSDGGSRQSTLLC